MRILPYYILHTLKNSIKKLFKTWVAVFLAVVLAFGLIGGIVGYTVGSVVEDNTAIEETIEEELSEDSEFTEQDIKEMHAFCRGAVMIITLLIILFSIYGGDKSGTKIFTLADVNFLFASPMAPQSVLMFKTILQMGVAILSSVYLLFQLPNLMMNVGLSLATCLTIFLAYAFLIYYSRLASVVTYTVTATNEKLRRYIRPFVISVIALCVFAFLGYCKAEKLDYFRGFLELFGNGYLEYLPVFGWMAGLVMNTVNGNTVGFIIYLLLIIASCILFTVLIWKIKADFYEDALSFANETAETQHAAQTGETVKRKKERSKRISRNGEIKGVGASVFYTKTVYNRKRFALFGVLSPTCGTYSAVALGITLALIFLLRIENVLPLGFILAVFIFFRNLGNPLASEMSHDYLYLVPEGPYKKVFYCLLGCVYETALDLLPAAVITAIAFPSLIPDMLLWYILWVSLDVFCSSVGLFIELIMPTSIVPSIKTMFAIFIRMFTVVPGLIMLILGAALSMPILIFATVGLNLVCAFVLSAVSPIFLHSGKK